MDFVDPTEAKEGGPRLSKGGETFYVLFHLGMELDNVLGVFPTAELVYEKLISEVHRDYIVVSLEQLRDIIPDSDATIVTKKHQPELRIARCSIENEPDPFMAM